MCSTRAVAESTNCPCIRNPKQAYAELKEESPLTTWVMTSLGWALVGAVGVAFAVIVWVITGVGMALRWAINRLWMALASKRAETPAVQHVEVAPVVKQPMSRWDYIDLSEPANVRVGA